MGEENLNMRSWKIGSYNLLLPCPLAVEKRNPKKVSSLRLNIVERVLLLRIFTGVQVLAQSSGGNKRRKSPNETKWTQMSEFDA